VKYLIVNGDDFGASCGINRGIIEAHRCGILTSASFLVKMPASEEAALLSRDLPNLSVGLHVSLINLADADHCRAELRRQLCRFKELIGRLPTHLNSHRNVHRDPRLRSHFVDLARDYGLPMREHSPVRYFSSFYGQWNGETHLEQISVQRLAQMLETEVREGFTELSCHPGYADPKFQSTYSIERETELRTLCDPLIREVLTERQINLISFREVINLLAGASI
jgi:chitin disaccharide deacetylase